MKKLTIILTLTVLVACTNKQKKDYQEHKEIYTPYSISALERVVIYDHCVKCKHGVYLPYQGKNVCTFCSSEKLVSK